jgi:hypothetical protein
VTRSSFYLIFSLVKKLEITPHHCTSIVEDVPRGISITTTDENETKPNMQMFRLSIVMAFIQGNPVQPFNPFGENRSQSVARQIQ